MLKGYNNHSILVGIVGLVIPIFLCACSTQKNTAASRSFHQTKVKYNIFYNGNISFEEGQRAIIQANEDDYSQIIPLYPISNHTAAQAATASMDKTIEKCRKCIKLHSIKAKPKIDPKKRSNPEYKLWLQSEEFNNQMGNVWIRLGEAEFTKGDFLGSIGTFQYVYNHYQTNPDVQARSQLMMARAYGELGWLYEAENILDKVNVDALSAQHAPLYAVAKADILIKTAQYQEAIPFVKIALPNEKRKIFRPRFYFILAQLYEAIGRSSDAEEAYTKCIRLAPDPTMEFEARIHKAVLQGKSSIKALLKMTSLSKNKDRLGRIYGAVGDIYLSSGDTINALDNYAFAVEKSTKADMSKATVLMTAGNLYYQRRQYELAQPYYQEAVNIISTDHPQYKDIRKRSEVLDELIVAYNAVQLQDSLQHLSLLPLGRQEAIVDSIIAALVEAEKKAEEEALIAQRESDRELLGVDTRNMLGGGAGQAGDWYFYNAQLVKSGKQAFAKQWGNRLLEDNWRRQTKMVISPSFADNEESRSSDTLVGDSVAKSMSQSMEMDPHQPAYYLQQIPRTPAQWAMSDSIYANALYDLIYIYEDKISDHALAMEAYQTFITRYPDDERILDLYYYYYLKALRVQDIDRQQAFAALIVNKYPDSKQAFILSQPDYFEQMQHVTQWQDSLYEWTYQSFKANDFQTVKENKRMIEKQYPLSPLMPNFLFLDAVAVARTEGQTPFVKALQDMVERYPSANVSAMAKDFLAMIGQGMESQKGTLENHIDEKRSAHVEEELLDTALWVDNNGPSLVLLVLPIMDEALLHELLYQVALYNFSQFMIKDFDISVLPAYAEGSAVRIAGFESLEEAQWYVNKISQDSAIMSFMQTHQGVIQPITEANFKNLSK